MIAHYLLTGVLAGQAVGAGTTQVTPPTFVVTGDLVEVVGGTWKVPATLLLISGTIVGEQGPLSGATFGPIGDEWIAEWNQFEGNAFTGIPDGLYTFRVEVQNTQGIDVYEYPLQVGVVAPVQATGGAKRIQYVYRNNNLKWLKDLVTDAEVVLEETPEDQTVVDNVKKELDSLSMILLESQMAELRRAIEQAEVALARQEAKKVLAAAEKALSQAKRRLDDEEAMLIL